MTGNLQLPIVDIEGIGPTLAGALDAVGLHVVGDLLRVPSDSIHAATASLASATQARVWRQAALLLEIPAMNPQWAEALVSGGVGTVADLAATDFNQLVLTFDHAKAARKIAVAPDAPAIASMTTSAAALSNTGALMGTVTSGAGAPVSGASIRIGHAIATTDARGRFRISLLPRGQKLLAVASHPDHGAARIVFEAAPTDAPLVRPFVLSTDSAPYRRSQLDGQRLPKDFGRFPFDAHEVQPDEIEPGDLLKVILLYADGRHAKLTSKLLTFDDGVVRVHWAKVPLQDLPPGIGLHDHLIRGAGWKKVTMNRQRLLSYKKLLQVKAAYRGQVLPPAGDARRAAIEEVIRAMNAAHVF